MRGIDSVIESQNKIIWYIRKGKRLKSRQDSYLSWQMKASYLVYILQLKIILKPQFVEMCMANVAQLCYEILSILEFNDFDTLCSLWLWHSNIRLSKSKGGGYDNSWTYIQRCVRHTLLSWVAVYLDLCYVIIRISYRIHFAIHKRFGISSSIGTFAIFTNTQSKPQAQTAKHTQ